MCDREPVQIVASLYSICLEKTAQMLTAGMWRKSSENPFKTFAPQIVEDLIASASSQQYGSKLSDLKLLIETRRFQKLELCEFVADENLALFPIWLSENVCKNLRVLKILQSLERCDMEAILSYCINLEEFHSSMLVGFGALKNCHKLRSWRVHLSNNDPDFLAYDTPDFPDSLKNLERFSVCNEFPCFFLYRKIAQVLENCPKITSIGMGDSSVALRYLSELEAESPRKFGLKRCHWGSNSEIISRTINARPFILLKNAVEAFPLVEELDCVVSYDFSLQNLTDLKHLNCLSIKSAGYADEFLLHLYSLLSGLGHQLKHLSVETTNEFLELENILLYCPNLETLRVDAPLSKSKNLNCGPLRLKRLRLPKCNKRVLMLLLFNCSGLEELFISDARCLRDDLLDLILDANPLLNLKIISLSYCYLTEDGLGMLFQSAKSLQVVHFDCGIFPPRFDYVQSISCLIDNYNLKIVNYIYEDLEEKAEFFSRKFSWCNF